MTNSRRRSPEDGHAWEKHEEDLCWGRNPVISLLEDDPSRCLKVTASRTMQRGTLEKIADLCRASKIPFSTVEPRAIDTMAVGENHQGVVAVIAASAMLDIGDAVELLPKPPSPAMVVLLDHVQDPHNLGAMIRSAEAASAIFVALPLRRSSLPTGTVVKTSAGASLRVPLVMTGNVASAVRELQEAGLWTVGLDTGGKKTIYSDPLPKRILFVVGGEGKGIGRTTASACDEILSIPTSGGVGSLNASVALALAMFEWSRVNYINENYKEGR
jgi:23S rRNA (guanosine2251-2'-O)-methyltransferase